MASNTAAWLTALKAKPLEVKPAPYTPPGENEIVVKNAALAVNPVDWKCQDDPRYPLNYPAILGHDVAGEVIEVGTNVSRFKKGDRVTAHALGWAERRNSGSGFQEYTVILPHMASSIPSTLAFEHAAVIPLGLSTAAAGLFQKEHLGLQHPSLNPQSTGKTLLVWGGASSVGSNGIQLAVAAGYEVITTASSKNFDYVKKLGACQVFDYNSKSVVDELIDAFKDKKAAGALDSVGTDGAFESCTQVIGKSKGDKSIATVFRPPENLPDGVRAKWIYAVTIKDNEVGKAMYEDFLPKALSEGKYIAAPYPYVVGKGLEYVQTGLDTLKKGISAKKVIVTL